ncbi:VOC family protein [Zobellia galactanivorans]|uniref:VOC family protein n=1 Tax=Zobellia galactanivorans (strain DSM 12802 / CCUG 47099 / CIP 106680 / NCIMB 13871 / Dsij) TaxID=63186 RepID=UPI0002F18B9A|nr:VOC family protein [Zobellia galactanivorans]MDO6810465.1 VOC family protein [Zobellia galactanivorans]
MKKKITRQNTSHTDSREEADRLFSSLAQEGGIKLPISEQFWGSYYGICLDKFGVNWKISFSQAPD